MREIVGSRRTERNGAGPPGRGEEDHRKRRAGHAEAGHRGGELQHPELPRQRRHHRKHGYRQRGADPQKRADREGQRPARYRHRDFARAAGGQRRQGGGGKEDRRAERRTGRPAGGDAGARRHQEGRGGRGLLHSAGKPAQDHRDHPRQRRHRPKAKRKPNWPKRRSPSRNVSWTPRSASRRTP